jgi:hypothetical protein
VKAQPRKAAANPAVDHESEGGQGSPYPQATPPPTPVSLNLRRSYRTQLRRYAVTHSSDFQVANKMLKRQM